MVCAHIAETFEPECVVDRTHTCEEHAYRVCSSCEWTSGSEVPGKTLICALNLYYHLIQDVPLVLNAV